MEIKGLGDLEKRLQKLSDDAEALDGSHEVPLKELLNTKFLSKHTQFTSLSELIDNSGFDVKSAEDFEAIPDDEWDRYVSMVSDFQDWKSMLSSASKSWAVERLGLR